MDLLYRLSDFNLFVIICLVTIIFSIAVVIIIKKLVPHEIRYKDNAVIGNAAQLISLIYGVLAGLTAVYLINIINYATDAAQREANAIANIYRDTTWLKEPTRSSIEKSLKDYLYNVINVEWPLMEKGQDFNISGDFIVNGIFDKLKTYKITNSNETVIVQDILQETKSLYDARQHRIHLAFSSLNSEIWIVMLIGTILTIFINYFYGINIYMHIMVISAVTLMTTSMIFLLVTLDRPFQGEFVVEPDAFSTLLSFIDKHPNFSMQSHINS